MVIKKYHYQFLKTHYLFPKAWWDDLLGRNGIGVDVFSKELVFIEIAGGGQYDRLVGSFLKNTQVNMVPCAGFSFGLNN